MKNNYSLSTRRDVLKVAGGMAVGLISGLVENGKNTASGDERLQEGSIDYYNIQRDPDLVTVHTASRPNTLKQNSSGYWHLNDIAVQTDVRGSALLVSLTAATSGVNRVRLRWLFPAIEAGVFLGDAWERAYGDLEWRGMVPERIMPWYFANSDGNITHCYGVRTGPASLCFWQVDPDGISLWADVRSGGSPVELRGRTLEICKVVSREGKEGESPHDSVHAFCKDMCQSPRLASTPIFGCNDWYYAYGSSTADTTRRDARTIVSLTASTGVRPFTIIDGGWQSGGGGNGGDWSSGTDKFPDMPGLAADIIEIGARPGIWFRPLYATQDIPASMRSHNSNVLDPTAPGVLDKVHVDTARFVTWGFQLIKHDFSTYDILGRWGFEMGPSPTADGWQFAEGTSRTTAEIILELYRTIRVAAGSALINGCNVLTHLSAGLFELCRIGDDNSGHQWARTRKMGINSLAFRACQNQAFYSVDPDCIGITAQVPWFENKQMLDLVSRSGAATFISLSPDVGTPDVLVDCRKSLAQTAICKTTGKPLDWQHSILPAFWKFGTLTQKYDWVASSGVDPFENI